MPPMVLFDKIINFQVKNDSLPVMVTITLWHNYSKKEIIYKSWLLLLLIAGMPDQSTLLNQTDSPDSLIDPESNNY